MSEPEVPNPTGEPEKPSPRGVQVATFDRRLAHALIVLVTDWPHKVAKDSTVLRLLDEQSTLAPTGREAEGKGVHPASVDASAARDRLHAFIRAFRPGGCEAVSLGSECQCPLCDVDRLFAVIEQQEGTIKIAEANNSASR